MVTLAHLRTQQARRDPDNLYAAKWQLTKLLFQRGWSKKRIIALLKVISLMMALPEPQQARYWRNVVKLEKERNMEWISPLEESFMEKGRLKGLKQGLKEGREEGREEGRKEGAAELLERQLTQRFGPLPQTARNKLAKASMKQLGGWSVAVFHAQSLKQVFATASSSPALRTEPKKVPRKSGGTSGGKQATAREL